MNHNDITHRDQLFGHFSPWGGTAITDQARTGSALYPNTYPDNDFHY